jgi:hypothetical protein
MPGLNTHARLTSDFGTFRTSRDVQFESAMRIKADIADAIAMGAAPARLGLARFHLSPSFSAERGPPIKPLYLLCFGGS